MGVLEERGSTPNFTAWATRNAAYCRMHVSQIAAVSASLQIVIGGGMFPQNEQAYGERIWGGLLMWPPAGDV